MGASIDQMHKINGISCASNGFRRLSLRILPLSINPCLVRLGAGAQQKHPSPQSGRFHNGRTNNDKINYQPIEHGCNIRPANNLDSVSSFYWLYNGLCQGQYQRRQFHGQRRTRPGEIQKEKSKRDLAITSTRKALPSRENINTEASVKNLYPINSDIIPLFKRQSWHFMYPKSSTEP